MWFTNNGCVMSIYQSQRRYLGGGVLTLLIISFCWTWLYENIDTRLFTDATRPPSGCLLCILRTPTNVGNVIWMFHICLYGGSVRRLTHLGSLVSKKCWILVSFSPKSFFLLCWFEGEVCVSNRYVLIHLITATSALLAKQWTMVSVPTLGEWRVKVYYVFAVSKLSAIGSSNPVPGMLGTN